MKAGAADRPSLSSLPYKIGFQHFTVVDEDILARDGAVDRREIPGEIRDLLRLRPFAQKRLGFDGGIERFVLQNVAVHGRDDAAGRDAVAGNPALGKRQGQIFHIAHNSRLAGQGLQFSVLQLQDGEGFGHLRLLCAMCILSKKSLLSASKM